MRVRVCAREGTRRLLCAEDAHGGRWCFWPPGGAAPPAGALVDLVYTAASVTVSGEARFVSARRLEPAEDGGGPRPLFRG